MLNPMDLLKLRPLLHSFKENHPKIFQFMKAAAKSADKGSTIEVTFTTAEGKTLRTNMKLTDDDLKLLNEIIKLK